MSDSHPNDEYLPFGDIELNDAGDVVGVVLRRYYDNKNYTWENWCRMADAIISSPALKEITFDCGYLDDEITCGYLDERLYRSIINALATVFGRKRTRPCALEEFTADDTHLGPELLAVMLPFLKSTPEIKKFSLKDADLGDEGIRLLSEVLNHIRIESLDLYGNNICREGLGQLFLAKNSKHLHKLDLECNPIGTLGFEAICCFLQRDDTEMKKLYFDYVDPNQFRTVLESISPQSKLTELFAEEGDHSRSHSRSQNMASLAAMSQILKKVVCDTHSFGGLCESNHQLVWVGPYMYQMLNSDPMLKKAVAINYQLAHGASIITRIKSKLRTFYFQGQFDLQPFIDIGVVFMPFILELVTRTECVCPMDDNDGSDKFSDIAGEKYKTVMEGDLGSIYHLVRNCHLPELFSFPSSDRRIQNYESRISSLEEENARLAAEIEDLRSQLSRSPKKRAKICDN